MNLALNVLSGDYCLFQLPPNQAVPASVLVSPIYSITHSENELSILCETTLAPLTARRDTGLRLLEFRGSVEWGYIGVVAAIAQPLAHAGISIQVVTTYQAGYFAVKDTDLKKALKALRAVGITVHA